MPVPTTVLLDRVRDNDRAALGELLQRIQPLIEQWVRSSRGAAIKRRFDTVDTAQDVMVDLVQYLPKVKFADSETFRRVLFRIVQNTLRDEYDYLVARRRRLLREQPISTGTVIDLDEVPGPARPPEAGLERDEEIAWFRLALGFLPPLDQQLILRAEVDGESYPSIAKATGLTKDAARVRVNRALARLLTLKGRLRNGEIGAVAAEEPEDDASATAATA